MNELCKTYKPEISFCPICGTKLVYRHSVSRKMVSFSSGKHLRIVNLGYSCPSCKDQRIYFSQTAHKFSWKGYTYSVKVMCMIARLRQEKKSREEICDYLFSKNISISDRNIDMVYAKIKESLKIKEEITIPKAILRMQKEMNQIAFSIDAITFNDAVYLLVYDFFNGDLLAFKEFPSLKDEQVVQFLARFLNPKMNITYIASIRKDLYLIPHLKKLCPSSTKFISYNKF